MTTSGSPRSSSAFTLGLCLFLVAIVFLLWTEHRAHLFGVLPWLILLPCPLVHYFMHRGHGQDATRGPGEPDRDGMHRHGGTL